MAKTAECFVRGGALRALAHSPVLSLMLRNLGHHNVSATVTFGGGQSRNFERNLPMLTVDRGTKPGHMLNMVRIGRIEMIKSTLTMSAVVTLAALFAAPAFAQTTPVEEDSGAIRAAVR